MVKLTGELEGFEVVMGAMTAREIIAIQRGTANEADVLDMVQNRAIEHNFAVDDLRDLDYWIVAEILDAWSHAMEATAVPPTSGAS